MIFFVGMHYELNTKQVYVTVLCRIWFRVRLVGQFQFAHTTDFISEVLLKLKKKIGSGNIILSIGVPFDDVLKSTVNRKARLSKREMNRIKERYLHRVWGVKACDFVVKSVQNRNKIELWAISREQLQSWERACQCNQVIMACVRPIEILLSDAAPRKRKVNTVLSCLAGEKLCWWAGVSGMTLGSGFCSSTGIDVLNHVSESLGADFTKKCRYYYFNKPTLNENAMGSGCCLPLTCGLKEVSMNVDFVFSFLLARSTCYAM